MALISSCRGAFFLVLNAGRSLGLDAFFARKPFGIFAGDGAIARLYRRFA